MAWLVVMQVFSTLLECLWLGRKSAGEKDLEILLLRRQLAIADRGREKPRRISRADKLTLAVLTARLKAVSGWPMKQLGDVIRLFQPVTVLKWHRELVRQKWTYRRPERGGRPRPTTAIEQLIVLLARDIREWSRCKFVSE